MIRVFIMTHRWLIALMGIVCIIGVSRAADEDVGVSSSPLEIAPGSKSPGGKSGTVAPRLQGEFVVHNPTNLNIAYQVQWGKKGAWRAHTIHPNKMWRHSHRLDDNGRAPSPFLRFDNRADDKRVTWKTYDVDFGRVGYAGPGRHINQAVHYEFTARGKGLDLVKR